VRAVFARQQVGRGGGSVNPRGDERIHGGVHSMG
jgi:hypothetical protein